MPCTKNFHKILSCKFHISIKLFLFFRDIFANLDLSWNRIKGGKKVGDILRKANVAFDLEDPAGIVPALMDAREAQLRVEQAQAERLHRHELEQKRRADEGREKEPQPPLEEEP